MTLRSWLYLAILVLVEFSASAQVTLHSGRSTLAGEHQPVVPPPPTDWIGDTDVIDLVIRPNSSDSGLSFITLSHISYGSSEGPIKLLDTHRGANASSYSQVHDNPHDVGNAQEESSAFSNWAEPIHRLSAVYAQVLNEQDVLLSRAEAFSTIESDVSHSSLTASGTLSAESFVLDQLTHSATSASATSTATARADYRVDEEVFFVVDAMLSGTVGLDLAFQITNRATGEQLMSEALLPGAQQRFEHCGTLQPGSYVVELSGRSNASLAAVDSATPKIEGAYDFLFAAYPASFDDPDEAEWDLPPGWELDLLDAEFATASVPEPSSANALLLGTACVVLLRRRR